MLGCAPAEAERTEQLLWSLTYYELTWEVARSAGRLKYNQARGGKTQSLADMIIAAVAMENGLVLITDNVKDFAIEGLTVYPMKQE